MIFWNGIEINVSELIREQFRFPKSKKKRIRKKWANRNCNFRPSRKAFKVGSKIFCHPQFLNALGQIL